MERSSTNLHKYSNAPIELYDLEVDIEEQNNLALEHPKIVDEIANIMEKEHILSKEFSFKYEQIPNL